MDEQIMNRQIEQLSEITAEYMPLLANASALLNGAMDDINWVGFYIVYGNELVLGPFQGKVACMKIAVGKGVCGTALKERRTVRVPDVHALPGHIACDADSRSEIVIPLFKRGEVRALLDIDSPYPDRFSERDQAILESFARTLERVVRFDGPACGTGHRAAR